MPPRYANLPQQPSGDSTNSSFELNSLNASLLEDSLDLQEELGLPEAPDDPKSTMKMAFMNMANSILGAGVIGQPYAIRQCGMAVGGLMVVVLTVMIDWTLRLIVINAKLSGTNSYQATVTHCFGRTGNLVIQLAQALFAYGGSIAFCVIIGDTIPHVLQSFAGGHYEDNKFLHWLLGRNVIIFVFTAGISFPLSLNRDISKLAKASAAALVGMLVIVTIVLVRGPMMGAEYKGEMEGVSSYVISPGVFQGISVISFALVCHHNTIFIYNSLRRPTLDRFTTLTHISCFVSMVVVAVMGLGGFLVFKDKTKANILNNFPKHDLTVNIARLCFGMNMLTTFPLEIFVAREVIKDFINPDPQQQLSKRNHFIITTLLVFSTMGISLMTCNLGAILELVGSTSACIMAYILPPLCFLKMTALEKTWSQRAPSIACVAFGVAVMIISSTQTIVKAINSEGSAHCNV
ncbi:hypothetical protein BABINDRAFT_161205 [Babjeviella inositovora NRRL Y-12698]|uniref:Amino acid transporter transmembrane domain-containing protein n=1 Tax=Babjeviella inositovora NRRL Y-12698 TaxID=984486 RepID=A0A1E3QR96_9ASCO|nr:uncharacterized protein BABINDRAFT_161205 [Babjeviella inositovora NRRL Y-12698]ODQ80236.1 hypothetical protein BABINDRAFT_161205 [Babjeviella inositovora NRRL Y-12698]